MRTVTLAAAIAAIALAGHAATPAKAPAKAGVFDLRDPASLVGLLKTMQAKAEIAKTEGALVSVKVETPGGNFGVQFVDCDASGKACKAAIFSTAFAARGLTASQMNTYNKSQVACRAFLADDGKPNVAYATLVNLRMTAEEAKQHIGVWQGCLASFGEYSKQAAS